MSDRGDAGLRIHRRAADGVVAGLHEDLTAATVPAVQKALTKLLLNDSRVLLDLSETRLSWAPAPELFVSAVSAAGGWPSARLVLFGADPHTVDRLRSCRVSETVPLADTVRDAALVIEARPTRLLRSERFPAHRSSVSRAGEFLHNVCRLWDVPDNRDRAGTIVGQLAANAVRHARTSFQLRLVLDGRRLRISVRDYRPGPLTAESHLAGKARPTGLDTVAALSDGWGVLEYDDGKAVWAVLDLTTRAAPSSLPTRDGRTNRHRRSPGWVVAPRSRGLLEPVAPVSVPEVRRQHFVSYDVEQAHEFLSSTYCRHTPHLAGSRDEFQLEFTTTATNSFAVERISHSMTVHGRFEPCPDLFVVRHRGGRLRISSAGTACETAPGDLLLVAASTEHEIDWTELDVEAVRLDPVAVAEVAAEVSGIDAAAVRFALGRPVSKRHAQRWTAMMRMVHSGVLTNDEVLASPLARSATMRHLATTLVETFPGPALDALNDAARAESGRVEPVTVRRAAQFVDEHACEDIGLADIARAARVGSRALQLAFRRHRDMTPLGYLRRVRLEHAHRDLLAADPTAGDTVAAIAARWGFAHHGYFAAAYRRVYGSAPNVTLRS